jgi:hypothetical protein
VLEAVGGGDALKGVNRLVNGAILLGVGLIVARFWPDIRRAYKGK